MSEDRLGFHCGFYEFLLLPSLEKLPRAVDFKVGFPDQQMQHWLKKKEMQIRRPLPTLNTSETLGLKPSHRPVF